MLATQAESRPRLDPRFTHLVTAEGSSALVGDEDAVILEHPVAVDVVRLLDGRRTPYDIAALLGELHRPELVHYALLLLVRGGLVREDQTSGDDRVELASESEALGRELRTAWEGRGETPSVPVRIPRPGGQPLDLVLTDDYLRVDHDPLFRDGPPRVLVALGASRVLVGPRIVPGVSACPACLCDRLRMNLVARSLVHLPADANGDGDTVRVERLGDAIAGDAWRAAAELLLDHLENPASVPLDGMLWSAALASRERASHVVARLPHCPVCGDGSLAPRGANVELRARARIAGSGGGFRTTTPAETLERFAFLISPLTGVVRRVTKVRVEGTDLIHVYTASHGRTRGRAGMKSLKSDRRDPSGGKGRTDLDARVSALCEALERSSAVHRGNEPVRLARRSELGDDAIHPNDLQLFSDAQLRDRAERNGQDPSGFQWISDPYEDEPIEWSPARSLATGSVRWVPSALVYLGFDGAGRRFCKGDSNGLAAGNCLEEAILQGFLELVERDAVALWWYNRARVPGLDLNRSRDPFVERVRAYYATLGRSLWALDLTTDLRIPCYAALSGLEGSDQQDLIFGFGAHFDPAIALSRAITEVNQMLPTVLRPREERARQLLPDFAAAIRWWDTARLEEQPYLVADPTRAATSAPTHDLPEDLLASVHRCIERTTAVGSDLLVHDLTRADIGLSVARVFAPGLRHFWARYAPGRLYDVPVRLGWTARPKSEVELNPIPMFV